MPVAISWYNLSNCCAGTKIVPGVVLRAANQDIDGCRWQPYIDSLAVGEVLTSSVSPIGLPPSPKGKVKKATPIGVAFYLFRALCSCK